MNVVPFGGEPPKQEPPEDPKLRQLSSKLRDLHESAGVPLPDATALTAPKIYVGVEGKRPTPQWFTRELVRQVRSRGLYVRNKAVGTVNERTGEFEPMSPHEFVTWVPQVACVTPYRGVEKDPERSGERLIEGDIGVEMARIFLASREVRNNLPELQDVNMVPLPVYRDELDERDDPKRKGFRKIELLREGYDPAMKAFTVKNGPRLDEKLDGVDAAERLFKRFKTFDWSGKDHLGRSDRMAVHFSAMLTVFGRYLFHGKAPIFLYGSNLEGSGKGVCVMAALRTVFPSAGASTLDPQDRTEMLKILDTKASSGARYLWADEMPDGIEINDKHLARWATATMWEMRPMGQNRVIEAHDITKVVTVLTANRVRVDRNIGRRVLHADFFPRQAASDRTLPKDTVLLDDEFFSKQENMTALLSEMWALVRMWDDLGRPGPTKDRPLETFEGWSRVVAAIVERSGLGRPLAPFEAPGAGDDDARMMKRLAALVIDEYCTEEKDGVPHMRDLVEITMKQIVQCARLNALFTERLSTVDQVVADLEERKGFKWKLVPDFDANGDACSSEPNDAQKREQAAGWLDQKMGSSWGKLFKKLAAEGQWFAGSRGDLYQFGDRGSTKQSSFWLKRVIAPGAQSE